MKNNKSEVKEGAKAGFWSGILASLCCVGPLVIVLFGLGSVSFALTLSQYRLYFLGFGFMFMSVAIILHLRKINKTCDVNCFSVEGLKRERKFIASVVLSMGIIYVLALYVIVPSVSQIIYENAILKQTQSVSSANSNNLDTNSNLHKLDVRISEMKCAGCAIGVQSVLQSLNGVIDAKISYPEGTGEVKYNSNMITKEEIIKSNAFSTYPAEIISDKPIGK